MFYEIELTPEQEEEARRIEDNLRAVMTVELHHMSRMLAAKSNRELFGKTEFQMRDALHRMGSRGLDTVLEERKKRGIEGQA